MKTAIIIDDEDRNDPGVIESGKVWTANIRDENGDTLADPGLGASRREALLDLLGNVDNEFPNFSKRGGNA